MHVVKRLNFIRSVFEHLSFIFYAFAFIVTLGIVGTLDCGGPVTQADILLDVLTFFIGLVFYLISRLMYEIKIYITKRERKYARYRKPSYQKEGTK